MTHTAHRQGSSLSITASFTYEDRRGRRCWTATGMLYYGTGVTRRQIMDDMWREIEDGFWPQIDDIVFSLFAGSRHIISWTPEHPAPDSGLPGSCCDFREPSAQPARYWRNPLEAHMPAIREVLGLGGAIEALRDLPADIRRARETGGWGRGISLEEAAPGIHLLLDMLGEGPAEEAIRALLADMGREREQERAELARILQEGRPRAKSAN